MRFVSQSKTVAFGLRTAFALVLVHAAADSARLAAAAADSKVSYNAQIRPLLSDKCFRCHGPDQGARKAKLRLDLEESARETKAIVPGQPDTSSLVKRIFSQNPREVMPPPETPKSLTPAEKDLLRTWIVQGAKYEPHWSYVPPVKALIPPGSNAVDYLLQQRLTALGLRPAPEANRRTLARRLYFDLVGLPPSPEEVAEFERDTSPDAYARVVEKLLSSPQYGERMAIPWLDVVRFADTIGYHSDNPRNIWPYRDYVIRALNSNKRFDTFTREQLAGDLLPESGVEQKVGSAFNRLLLSTEEGGAQPKDYEYRMLTDRVRAVGTVWLGQTLGCAACHDHRFDPVKMKDFYSLGAFFADIKEPILGQREPGMPLPSKAQEAEQARLETQVASLKKEFDGPHPELESAFTQWEKEARAASSTNAAEPQQALFARFKSTTPLLEAQRQAIAKAEKAAAEFQSSIPKCLVTVSTEERRTVHILPRGDFLKETAGETVEPALPAYLGGTKASARENRMTRLDLANWLVSPENPLTARVTVNRLWKQFFGMGLSRVLDDLGSQGEAPPNPALLDWLACEFMDSGWDLRHMVRLMVTSHAYRQTSSPAPELRSRDPYNREIACQSRWRLDAELVRDAALSLGGILNQTIGCPSAKPYQPVGYWDNLNFPTRTYESSSGPDQFRRGLYTWWQRSYLHPSIVAFDAPSREECVAERTRSNIPQQALVLLNDPTYVEAARAFGLRILQNGGTATSERITWAWRQALARDPQPEELQALASLQAKLKTDYEKDRSAAEAFLKVGQMPCQDGLDPAELAAWAQVARAILNLHETITRS